MHTAFHSCHCIISQCLRYILLGAVIAFFSAFLAVTDTVKLSSAVTRSNQELFTQFFHRWNLLLMIHLYSRINSLRSLVADLLGEDDHTQSYVSSQNTWRSISRDWRHGSTPFSHEHILLPLHNLILKNLNYPTFRRWGTTITYWKIFSKLDTSHTLYPPCPKNMTQPIFSS